MSSEKDEILTFNQYITLDKVPYIIYADLESLIKKIDGCATTQYNNIEKISILYITGKIL